MVEAEWSKKTREESPCGGGQSLVSARTSMLARGLAMMAILQSYWGIDVAVFAPQLLLEGIHWGYYMLAMYIQGILAGIFLFITGVRKRE